MAESFYTILTAVGKAKIANAHALGMTVNLTRLAVGDGNGSYYNPTESQTALRNELWRGAINSITVDQQNPNWIVIEAVIPANVGGFMIREVGVFDDAGDMIAVGKYPETYKPVLAEGSAKDLYIRMILEVSNASAVTLKIDPAVVLATKKQVDEAEARAKAYTDTHEAKAAPHPGHALASDLAALATAHSEHLADYANPHQVKAEQVFSIGGIPSGTAFPTTPANYTLFYRTDLKKLFIYLPLP